MFESTVTGLSYKVCTSATFKTKNLVYVIKCVVHAGSNILERERMLYISTSWGPRSDIRTNKLVAEQRAP